MGAKKYMLYTCTTTLRVSFSSINRKSVPLQTVKCQQVEATEYTPPATSRTPAMVLAWHANTTRTNCNERTTQDR